MELYVFDRSLNFKGIVEQFSSLRWVRRYHRCGEFELHGELTPETLDLLKKGNVVWKKGDLEAGYIEYRNLSQNDKETLIAKGRFLTGYLGQRIIWGIKNFDTTSELAIRSIIYENCINPDDATRAIDLIELGEIKGYGHLLKRQTSYKNILDEIERISVVSGLGFRTLIDLQNKKIIFDIYEGADRTSEQSANPPAIFANEFENVFEQEYTDSLHNYRNAALVAGEGEGIDREIVSVGGGQGIDRYELFVDARDLQSVEYVDGIEIPIPPERYRDMLTERGTAKLLECTELQTFESKINDRSNLHYKEDFDLGDIVTVANKKWGVTINARITEIEEAYELGKQEIYATFGDSAPTLTNKIKAVVM